MYVLFSLKHRPPTRRCARQRNVRLAASVAAAAASGPSFGSLGLKDIDLRGTTITIGRR